MLIVLPPVPVRENQEGIWPFFGIRFGVQGNVSPCWPAVMVWLRCLNRRVPYRYRNRCALLIRKIDRPVANPETFVGL